VGGPERGDLDAGEIAAAAADMPDDSFNVASPRSSFKRHRHVDDHFITRTADSGVVSAFENDDSFRADATRRTVT